MKLVQLSADFDTLDLQRALEIAGFFYQILDEDENFMICRREITEEEKKINPRLTNKIRRILEALDTYRIKTNHLTLKQLVSFYKEAFYLPFDGGANQLVDGIGKIHGMVLWDEFDCLWFKNGPFTLQDQKQIKETWELKEEGEWDDNTQRNML